MLVVVVDLRLTFAADDLTGLLGEVGDHVVGDRQVNEVLQGGSILRWGWGDIRHDWCC